MSTKLEKKIIAAIQGDISITSKPYLEIANKLEISEKKLLGILADLCDQGVIRRFGATLHHQKSGFKANAMVAWKVDKSRIDEVGNQLASFKEVSHCYSRIPGENWPYTLYTMVHAKNSETCIKIASKMAERVTISDYKILFSKRELKKTSMKYFS